MCCSPIFRIIPATHESRANSTNTTMSRKRHPDNLNVIRHTSGIPYPFNTYIEYNNLYMCIILSTGAEFLHNQMSPLHIPLHITSCPVAQWLAYHSFTSSVIVAQLLPIAQPISSFFTSPPLYNYSASAWCLYLASYNRVSVSPVQVSKCVYF